MTTAQWIRGAPWQDVLGHRVELGDPTVASSGAPGIWDSSLWDDGLWAEGWAPRFEDITARCLTIHSTRGAQGLDVAKGSGTIELELLNRDGALSPGGSTEGLLGRHVRGFVTPAGRTETAAFYGFVDRADIGGTFAVPTVSITAYDTRSLLGAARAPLPVADTAQSVHDRLAITIDAAEIPAGMTDLEADTTPLLADETVELGDLFGRTLESGAGLGWCSGAGVIVTRHRDWRYGTATALSAYIYAGDPPSPPPAGVPLAQATDIAATEGLATIKNVVTYENRAEPPVKVTVRDEPSIGRYGMRSDSVSDLSCDAGLLAELAARELELRKQPVLITEGATVTVYDEATAAIAALELGDVVITGRNNPGVEQWEFTGVVLGLELNMSGDRCEVAVTVSSVAGLSGGPGLWDSAQWNRHRWS